jgi:hypothetical protein
MELSCFRRNVEVRLREALPKPQVAWAIDRTALGRKRSAEGLENAVGFQRLD